MGERADVTRDYGQPAPESVADESPEELRVEIAQTRTEMSGTIDAIQEQLNPDRLKAQVTDAVREQVDTVKENIRDATVGRAEQMVSNMGDTAQRAGSGFVGTIKQNPIPAALAALGIGWLWMKRSGGDSQPGKYRFNDSGNPDYSYRGERPYYGAPRNYGAAAYGTARGEYGDGRGQASYGAGQGDQSIGDRVGDVAGQAKDTVGNAAGQAKDVVGNVAGQAKDTVGQFAGQAQDQVGEWGGQMQSGAQQAWSSFDRMLHENPLGVSAAAVAVGLAIGMSLPDTPVEDRLMGEARDNVMEKAKAQAQDTMQKVGQVAQQVQETAKSEAQKQGLTGGDQGASSQGNTQQRGQQSVSQQSESQQSSPQRSGASATGGNSGTPGASSIPRPQGQQSAQQPGSTTP